MSIPSITGSSRASNDTSTPALEKFGRDLTKLAKEGKISPAIGRDKEINKLAQALSRKTKSNAVLVGPYGVGKTAIVEHLALQIFKGECPSNLLDKRLIELSLSAIVGGTKFRGQMEARLNAIVKEATNPDIILFIDEIHTIMGLGAVGGSMDASNILKPALARGEIRVIGATTTQEYTELEKDGAFKRRFMKVNVDEPTIDDTINIITKSKSSYEAFHNIRISSDLVPEIVRLSRRYITDRFSPDRELDVLDLLGSKIFICNSVVPEEIKIVNENIQSVVQKKQDAIRAQKYEEAASILLEENKLKSEYEKLMNKFNSSRGESEAVVVTKEHIADILGDITGIDISKIGKKDSERLSNLEWELNSVVVGQEEAIEAVSKAVRRSRSGISRSNRPEFVGLFLGSTGTGKTHAAKKLAEMLYDTSKSFLKIDMSEFMDPSTITKLIGAPPSFVGYEDNNNIFETVRTSGGRMVILLDEFEKAHPRIVNLFLQIFDEGQCHDSKGNMIDFRNSIIILTSNLGVKKLKDFGTGIGFVRPNNEIEKKKAESDVLMKELKKSYAPEVINRFDEVVVFNTLGEEQIQKIADLNIDEVVKRAQTLNYTLVIDDSVRKHVASVGFDAEYGGRYLNRAITTYIEDSFATFLFKESPAEGSTICIKWDETTEEIDINVL